MKIFASIIYLLTDCFIWFPIGYLCALVDSKITIVLFLLLLIRQSAKMYLGVKNG